MKAEGKKIGKLAKVIMGLTLFLEFFRYAAVALFLGLVAFGVTTFLGAAPLALIVFGAVVASLTFVSLVRTVLAVVAVNKTVDLTQNISESFTQGGSEVTFDVDVKRKSLLTQTAEVATQTAPTPRSKSNQVKFFTREVLVDDDTGELTSNMSIH